MAKVSISEAARLTGKSRTTLHRLIKAGELSTCRGERNAKMLETSELLRVFGAFAPVSVEQAEEQVSGQRDTVTSDRNEQVIHTLKQEIEHLNTLLASKDSHIDSLKQAMLLLDPMMQSFTKVTPILDRFSISTSTILFGRRNSGIPYFNTPPISCSASNTVTS